jgi:hypothetical protein
VVTLAWVSEREVQETRADEGNLALLNNRGIVTLLDKERERPSGCVTPDSLIRDGMLLVRKFLYRSDGEKQDLPS